MRCGHPAASAPGRSRSGECRPGGAFVLAGLDFAQPGQHGDGLGQQLRRRCGRFLGADHARGVDAVVMIGANCGATTVASQNPRGESSGPGTVVSISPDALAAD